MTNYKELIERLNDISKFLGFESTSCVCLAAEAIERLVKERDAAIADLEKVADCRTCGNINTFCQDNPDACKGYVWRGVPEVEHETD